MRALVQAVLLLIVVAIAGIGLQLDASLGVHRRAGPADARHRRLRLPVDAASRRCVKKRERFMGIGQLIMMPLFFASSALYPLAIMPGWLHVIARVNPLTYEVQGLRQMLVGVGGGELWLDFLVVFVLHRADGGAGDAALPARDSLGGRDLLGLRHARGARSS